METKEEIIKKKGGSPTQLDLVDTVDKKEKLVKKRITVAIFLVLSIGLSVSFWIYRSIAISGFKFNPSSLFQIDRVSNLIKKDRSSWQICLINLDSKTVVYSQNCPPDFQFDSNLSDFSKNTTILPEGVDLKEKIVDENNIYQSFYTLTIPDFHFGIYLRSNSLTLSPEIISRLYWDYVLSGQ